MISKRSFYNFLSINLFFYTYGFFEYSIYHYFTHTFFTLFFLSTFRNYFLYTLLDYNTEKYDYIYLHRNIASLTDYKENFLKISLLDSVNLYFLLQFSQLFYKNSDYNDFLYDMLYFIPKSFLFEIIFDLFHYITHRLEHKTKFFAHKIHHQHHTPTLVSTFNHHILDLICTNVIPFYITSYICIVLLQIRISNYMLFILYISKIYIELCGHSGKNIKHIGSFVQCVWLPRLLDIDLYTIDHTNHHYYNNCNYSKRFSLWDRIFGTYR
jgi:sterol desaturase/sphingolipid hydroxylase (fatty acid hydroxylase superfamily)